MIVHLSDVRGERLVGPSKSFITTTADSIESPLSGCVDVSRQLFSCFRKWHDPTTQWPGSAGRWIHLTDTNWFIVPHLCSNRVRQEFLLISTRIECSS